MAPLLARLGVGGGSGFGFGRKSGGAVIPFSATGGTISTPGDGYKYHSFISPGNFNVTGTVKVQAEIAMVGGGGGANNPGGGTPDNGGGGGGGGSFVNFVYEISGDPIGNPQAAPVIIGNTSITFGTTPMTAGGGATGPGRPAGSGPVAGGAGGTVSNPQSIPVIRSSNGLDGGAGSQADEGGNGGSAGHTSPRASEWWIPWMGPGTGGATGASGVPGTPGNPYGGGGGGGGGENPGDPSTPGGSGAPGRLVIRYLI